MWAFKGMNGPPTANYHRLCKRNAGYPTGREAHGYEVPVILVGVTTYQGDRQVHEPVTGGRGTGCHGGEGREVRRMQCAATLLATIRDRGKQGLPLEEVYI